MKHPQLVPLIRTSSNVHKIAEFYCLKLVLEERLHRVPWKSTKNAKRAVNLQNAAIAAIQSHNAKACARWSAHGTLNNLQSCARRNTLIAQRKEATIQKTHASKHAWISPMSANRSANPPIWNQLKVASGRQQMRRQDNTTIRDVCQVHSAQVLEVVLQRTALVLQTVKTSTRRLRTDLVPLLQQRTTLLVARNVRDPLQVVVISGSKWLHASKRWPPWNSETQTPKSSTTRNVFKTAQLLSQWSVISRNKPLPAGRRCRLWNLEMQTPRKNSTPNA